MEPTPTDRVSLAFELNGRPVSVEVAPDRILVDLLRDDLGLTGTKLGCAVGVCGTCAVLIDGRLLSACLVPAVRAQGRRVTTIEGIAAPDGELSAVQSAFLAHGGFQCGICTPGQVVAATALLAEHPAPDDAQLTEWMTGQLCRCTGYAGIRRSILAAAAKIP
jgi:carbon-monoxide dehydrogenase small subunit